MQQRRRSGRLESAGRVPAISEENAPDFRASGQLFDGQQRHLGPNGLILNKCVYDSTAKRADERQNVRSDLRSNVDDYVVVRIEPNSLDFARRDPKVGVNRLAAQD